MVIYPKMSLCVYFIFSVLFINIIEGSVQRTQSNCMFINDFVLVSPNLHRTSMSYYMYLKNLKLYKNRCGFTLSLYFQYIELSCSSTMSLWVLEVLTYTVCARRVSLTSSLSNQTSVLSHILTWLLPRSPFEATTIWCYLGFYVQ